jgi:hypothetical protein
MVQGQLMKVDSLFGDQGVRLIANNGFLYNGEVSIKDDGDIYIQGRNHRIVFIFGIMEVIRTGLYHLDACGTIASSYPVNGVWNNEFEPMYVEKSLVLNDKTLYAAGERVVNNINTPCMQKADSLGNVLVEFESPSTAYFTNPNQTIYWKYLDFHHDSTLQKITCIGRYLYGNESGIFLSVFNEDGTRDATSFTDGTRVIPVQTGESYVFNRTFKRSTPIDSNRFLLSSSSWQGDSLILAMVKLDGTLDATFGNNGLLYDSSYNLSEGSSSIVTTERRFYQTEVIGDHFFVSSLELDNDSFRCNLRKYDFNGQLDNSFGVNGKKSCFIFESSSLSTFLMEKVGDDQLLLSYLKFVNQPTDSSFFMVLDEFGQEVTDFPISRGELKYNNELMIVDQIEMLDNGTAFVVGSSSSGKMVLMKFRDELLFPELSLNGNELNSNITSTDVYFEWYLNGSFIEGENDSIIFVDIPGEYTVNVITENCFSTRSDTLMVEFVGQSMLTSRSFNIFPNPAHSTISIASNTSNFDYSIFDTSGRIMLSGKCKNDNQVIDVSEFLPGVYFIRIGEEMLRVVVF